MSWLTVLVAFVLAVAAVLLIEVAARAAARRDHHTPLSRTERARGLRGAAVPCVICLRPTTQASGICTRRPEEGEDSCAEIVDRARELRDADPS